jgi:HEAT repeat protein
VTEAPPQSDEPAICDEVAKFRAWAERYSVEDRYGEWECDYPGWTELHSSFTDYLDATPTAELQSNVVADLIYAIARDNEISYLASQLGQRPVHLLRLLPHVLVSEEPDARWQIAAQLGKHTLPFEAAEPALIKLVADQDEYVRRIALQALGHIDSPRTEHFCCQAWESGHEYQRIMALWVLHTIGSRQLDRYLALATDDGREYLLVNVDRIKREKTTGSTG